MAIHSNGVVNVFSGAPINGLMFFYCLTIDFDGFLMVNAPLVPSPLKVGPA